MSRVVLTYGAREDLKEIKEYISRTLGNLSAANGIVKGIIGQLRGLEQFPRMGSAIVWAESPVDYRYLVYGNYMSFYHIQKDLVIADRILYSRRDYLKILLDSEADEQTELQS